jgi:hypothetical protein
MGLMFTWTHRYGVLLYPSVVAASLLGAGAGPNKATAQAGDPIIYRPQSGQTLWGGRATVFSQFQKQLQDLLTACGKATPFVVAPGAVPDGQIGPGTRAGIIRAMNCPSMSGVPANSPGRQGAITQAVWNGVMPNIPAPSLDQRVNALVLTFEATDFGSPPEWNFCQDGPRDHPTAPGFVCKNRSDPCSMLTWAPRGATAGGGREIHWVLWLARQDNQALIDNAFGAEASAMQRFLRLKADPERKCPNDPAIEKFMCAVWITPARKAVWNKALVDLGNAPAIRAVFDKLYASRDFDGGKVARFFRFWSELGLAPTQADYAYFVDRATQTNGPARDATDFANQVAQVRTCMPGEPSSVNGNAKARRCYSRNNQPGNQSTLRLGRDVAFYKDSYPPLTSAEQTAWSNYKKITISDLAISDATAYGAYSAPSIGTEGPVPDSDDLTPEENSICPASVLNPVRN